jgi:hypothetical protein
MASLTMLTSWSIWNEKYTRVFTNKSAPATILFKTIKDVAKFQPPQTLNFLEL